MIISKPLDGEYPEHHREFIHSLPEGAVVSLLEGQPQRFQETLGHLSDQDAKYRYAEGKWSIKEIVGHTSDTERIMAYRLLRIARGDESARSGFDENQFVAGANFDNRTLNDLLEEQRVVREATLLLLKSLPEEALLRMGAANGSPVSVRAIAHIIAGHTEHHLGIIKERYLPNL